MEGTMYSKVSIPANLNDHTVWCVVVIECGAEDFRRHFHQGHPPYRNKLARWRLFFVKLVAHLNNNFVIFCLHYALKINAQS